MRKIKDVLRVRLLWGAAPRIGLAVGCGKTAVAECLRRAVAAGLTDWVAELIAPYPSDAMTAHPVSTAVNNVRNHGVEPIAPLAA